MFTLSSAGAVGALVSVGGRGGWSEVAMMCVCVCVSIDAGGSWGD